MSYLVSLSHSISNKKLTTRINCFHLWSIIFQIGSLYLGHLCELTLNHRSGEEGMNVHECRNRPHSFILRIYVMNFRYRTFSTGLTILISDHVASASEVNLILQISTTWAALKGQQREMVFWLKPSLMM